MFDGARAQRVRSGDGVELALVHGGMPGTQTLVFVHGYPDTKELWQEILEQLAPRYRVIAYDVRGAGASSAPRGAAAYDFERLAADFEAVIDALSPEQPVHLIGHDWGGIAGWEFVADARFDGRIASFTTIAGPSLRTLTDGLREQLHGGHLLRLADRLRRSWYVLALCTPGVPTLAWRGGLREQVWARYLRYVEHIPAERSQPPRDLAKRASHGANLYRRNVLWRTAAPGSDAPVRVPVQLILPSGDRWISPGYYEGLERRVPVLLRRTVAGSHWAPLVHPELLAGWISSFVEDGQLPP